MNRVLFYVAEAKGDPELVRCAADLVEFATVPVDRGGSPDIALGIVAEVEDCLEIGLPMLGRAAPRTVEGGERAQSRVHIFPFVGKQTGDRRQEQVEALDVLFQSGAVEMRDVSGKDAIGSAREVLRTALNTFPWQAVAEFGFDAAASELIDSYGKDNGLARVRALDLGSARERTHALRSDDDLQKEDPFLEIRRDATAYAVIFDDLLAKLNWREIG